MKNEMIKNWMKGLTFGVCLLSCGAAMTSCSDDDDDNNNQPNLPVVEQMEIQRLNTYYDITVPGNSDWEVTKVPEWVGVTALTGKSGEAVNIFTDTNDEDDDRSDTLAVSTTDGKRYCFVLKQLGLVRDPDNGAIISAKDMWFTYGVGYGINLLASSAPVGMKYNVLANTPLNFPKLFNFIVSGSYLEGDAVVEEERYYSRSESITGSNTKDIANQLAINGSIEPGFDAFSGSVKGHFSDESTTTEHTMYAQQEVKHIVASRYIRSGLIRALAEKPEFAGVLQGSFRKAYNTLKTDPGNKAAIAKILNTYGSHLITYGALGGELYITMKLTLSDVTKESDIHGALNLTTKYLNIPEGKGGMTSSEKNVADNLKLGLTSYGGNNAFVLSPGSTFEQFQNQVHDPKVMAEWVDGLIKKQNLSLIDIETIPMYDLMPNAAAREAMRRYMLTTYQQNMKNDKNYKPDLYIITGFDTKSNKTGEGSIELSNINLVVEAKRASIPDLAKDENSTVIYSGEKGKVNHRCGFFVGNSKTRPAKVFFDENGKVTSKIEFTEWAPGAVTKVYADASGEITIAAKNLEDLYQEMKMTWK